MGGLANELNKDPLFGAVSSGVKKAGQVLGRVGENMTEGRYLNNTAKPVFSDGAPPASPNSYQRPKTTTSPKPGRAGVQQGLVTTQVNAKGQNSARPISHAQMNAGGGPGQDTMRDAVETEFSHLFNPPAAAQTATPQYTSSGADLNAVKNPLPYNGAFAPGGDFGPGGKLAPGSPGGMAFSGKPTMAMVQQSVPGDIFGDTQDLINQRNQLQAGIDQYFSKNPLGNDLMANFNSLVSQAGNFRNINAINDRLKQRDALVAQLQNTMVGGGIDLQKQGLANEGQLAATQMNIFGQQGIETMRGQNNIALEGMRGSNALAQVDAQGKNTMANTRINNEGELAKQNAADIAAGQRNDASNKTTLAAAAGKDATQKNIIDLIGHYKDILKDPNIPDDQKKLYMQKMNALEGMAGLLPPVKQ